MRSGAIRDNQNARSSRFYIEHIPAPAASRSNVSQIQARQHPAQVVDASLANGLDDGQRVGGEHGRTRSQPSAEVQRHGMGLQRCPSLAPSAFLAACLGTLCQCRVPFEQVLPGSSNCDGASGECCASFFPIGYSRTPTGSRQPALTFSQNIAAVTASRPLPAQCARDCRRPWLSTRALKVEPSAEGVNPYSLGCQR
jgi:hypothetical protein